MAALTFRQTCFLVVLFVVTSLSFIALDNRRALDPVKTGLYDLVSPVSRAFGNAADGGDAELESKLARVVAERDALLAENARLRQAATEIEQLRAQLGVKEEHPDWQLLSARVINPDPSSLQKFITIDRGAKHGVEVGMAVVDPTNYVGQVSEVWEESARVTLIIDATQRVGARLDSGADGVIYGRWQHGGRLELRHVNRDVEPEAGELVLTSDLASSQTARVPGGQVIGVVNGEPELDRQSDTLTIPVLPAANFDNLKVVTVILADAP